MKIEEVVNSLASGVLPQHSAHGRLKTVEEGVGGGVFYRGGGQREEQCYKPGWSTCSSQKEDRIGGKVEM